MNDILPKFLEESFRFPDGEVPPHIEEYPSTATYVGLFSVFGLSGSHREYPVAEDIQDESLAFSLAKACAKKQAKDKKLYGYTDAIGINYPNGKSLILFQGTS